MIKILTLAVLAVIITAFISYQLGRIDQQKEIIKRAKTTNDVEIIIFGESQL